MSVNYKSEGLSTVTPYISSNKPQAVLDFVTATFDVEVTNRLNCANGEIWHAQIQIGDSAVLLGHTMGQMQPLPQSIYVYVKDVDGVYQKALKAGGQSYMEPTNHFYGDRSASVKDPAGNIWHIATHIEDVSQDELVKRAREFEKQQKTA